MNANASRSAKIISFQSKAAKPGFAQAREGWMRWCCADLTPAERNFVTSLAMYFNASQYKKSDELVAWPAWETLVSEWGLSKPTIWRAQRKLEQQGKLKVIHGRFNPITGHKSKNQYRAVSPSTRFQSETWPGFKHQVSA